MIEEWKLGYLAGMIDGEGSISILKTTYGYGTVLRITNSDREMLEFLQSLFGGKIYSATYGIKPRWKEIWQLQWGGEKAKEILILILDKLQIKKDRAAILISFPQLGQGSSNVVDSNSIEKRKRIKENQEEFFLLMKKLNKRGGTDVD